MKRFLKALYNIWMSFARIFGKVQTAIILFLIYFLGIGIIAGMSFIFRKDFLDKGLAKDKETFWRPREAEKPTLENSKRQF